MAIEEAIVALKQQKQQQEEGMQELRREGEHWRHSYEEALEREKRSEEWEVKCKAYAQMNKELTEQKALMAGQLEEMKVRVGQMEGHTSRSAGL